METEEELKPVRTNLWARIGIGFVFILIGTLFAVGFYYYSQEQKARKMLQTTLTELSVDYNNDTLRLQLSSLQRLLRAEKCEGRERDARNYIFTLKDALGQETNKVGTDAIELPQRKQQVEIVKELVNSKALAFDRLADTVIAGQRLFGDPALIAAVYRSAKWNGIYVKRIEGLEKSLATEKAVSDGKDADVKAANRRADAATASSLYAEGQWNKEARTKRFLGTGRKNNAVIQADSTRAKREQAQSVNELSDLEIDLNKKKTGQTSLLAY